MHPRWKFNFSWIISHNAEWCSLRFLAPVYKYTAHACIKYTPLYDWNIADTALTLSNQSIMYVDVRNLIYLYLFEWCNIYRFKHCPIWHSVPLRVITIALGFKLFFIRLITWTLEIPWCLTSNYWWRGGGGLFKWHNCVVTCKKYQIR